MWELGECNVRSVLVELNRRSDKERKYTTVMTTMARLDRKGLLVRRREGRTDIYKPAMTRVEYLRRVRRPKSARWSRATARLRSCTSRDR